MKKILTIVTTVNKNKYIGRDDLNRTFEIVSSFPLVLGDTVLTHNGSVIGKVEKEQLRTFEV